MITPELGAALAFEVACFYVVPVAGWLWLPRWLGAPRRRWGLGAVTWLCALPFIVVVPGVAAALLGGGDPARARLVWGAALSLTAALAEEISRAFWYRRRAVEDEASAVLAGAGHGGTEAFVLGLQFALGPLFAAVARPDLLPAQAQDPHAFALFAASMGASRLVILAAHVGLTLIVWRGVTRRRPAYVLLAVALHAAMDLAAFVLPAVVPGTDAAMFVLAVPLAAWALWRAQAARA